MLGKSFVVTVSLQILQFEIHTSKYVVFFILIAIFRPAKYKVPWPTSLIKPAVVTTWLLRVSCMHRSSYYKEL